MHLREGEIKAYQDQELDEAARGRIETHLANCQRCQARAAELAARSQRLSMRFSSLETGQPPKLISPHTARARMDARLEPNDKEKANMWNKLTTRVPRYAWVTLAIVAVLAASLAFPSVRAAANNFLGLFRVEQVRVVSINPADLPDRLGSSSNLENMLSQQMEVEAQGEVQEAASAAQAAALAGYPVRLPSGLEGEPKIFVQPGGRATFNVDLALVQSVLGDLGRQDIELPAALDGATVELVIPPAVMTGYGECDFDPEGVARELDPDGRTGAHVPSGDPAPLDTNCITLLQVPSPTISAPPGLNLSQIGEAYLQLLGMDPQEAERFARNVDWTTTLVVPIPRYGMQYKDQLVDGVTGTLMVHRSLETYVLLWVKDGLVYALNGPGNGADAVKIANSLK